MAMATRIAQLNRYLSGWVAYFALAETPTTFEELDKWVRRRQSGGALRLATPSTTSAKRERAIAWASSDVTFERAYLADKIE